MERGIVVENERTLSVAFRRLPSSGDVHHPALFSAFRPRAYTVSMPGRRRRRMMLLLASIDLSMYILDIAGLWSVSGIECPVSNTR